ncbi:tyrosine-type recombinase/integrase [Piscibacillus sp. B03]|uniref:tyrosine-type recombinase/integrase n=1 Tax=Piscibacillus sp. B03 TaxID=3457430 RepID=UPI003FCEC567
MPFGFADYLEKENKSEQTIAHYVRLVNEFFQHLDHEWPSELEVYEIGAKHITGYLRFKKTHSSNSTVNKHIAVLKKFFDYLWENNMIPIDPMSKIRYLEKEDKPMTFTYQELIEHRQLIYQNAKLKSIDKALFALSLYGITFSELDFKKQDVHVMDDDTIIINTVGKRNRHRSIHLEGIEAKVFYDYYQNMLFKPTDYVFVQKLSLVETEQYRPIKHRGIVFISEKIKSIEPFKEFSLTNTRNAYIYHLKVDHHYSIEQIAFLLGVSIHYLGTALPSLRERLANTS